MKILETSKEIEVNFSNFEADSNGAFPTCRVLPGQWEQENCQEWAEKGTISGAPAKVYYIFENKEAEVEDGGDIPFDSDHVQLIEIAEEDEGGEYDVI